MRRTPEDSSGLLEVLAKVQAFSTTHRCPCYLVGGIIRDQLLGRPLAGVNVDLAVPRGALEFSRALASELRGAFVPLDEDTGSARVVVGDEAGRLELDLNDFRGASLEEDLVRRDFTVNAIAVALPDWLRNPAQPAPMIDPLDGRGALARRRLIACFPGTFREDPVRILRGVRLAVQLGFDMDEALPDLMRAAVSGLARVAGERARDELIAICETDRAGWGVSVLDEIGAWDVLVPELGPGRGLDQGDFHHLDVLAHEVESVRQADQILQDLAEFSEPLRPPLQVYVAEPVTGRHTRKALIKFGALLHDVGKPTSRQVHPNGEIWFIGHEHSGAKLAEGIVDRLRFSNREAEMICRLVRHHLRPGFLSREPELTRRALYRFYKDLGEHGPACLLEWWADRLATRGTLSRVDQIDQQRQRLEAMLHPYFFRAEEVVRPPRLVDGHRLMRDLRLTPGPLIGELLGLIEEAQAEGTIRSAEEALALAREHLTSGRSA